MASTGFLHEYPFQNGPIQPRMGADYLQRLGGIETEHTMQGLPAHGLRPVFATIGVSLAQVFLQLTASPGES